MRRATFAIAALAGMFAGPAHAMQLDPDGRGEVLIYPYFTAQDSDGNDFNTYLSVVNDTASPKALRVRFREGRNGRELISFNMMLEALGTWSAAIVPGGEGAGFLTTDPSCTAPGPLSAVPFSSAEYTGAFDDGLGFDRARQREGYIEIFEMATLPATTTCDPFRSSTLPPASLQRPSGGLSGTLTLINVQSGLDFTVNAVALSDFATAPYFRAPGDAYPDYNAAEVAPVAVMYYDDDHLYRTTWDTPVQAVNAVFMAQTILNEVVIDHSTQSATDFVVTMPTRRLAPSDLPFSPYPAGSRDLLFALRFMSREGQFARMSDNCDFLCTPGQQAHLPLQWSSSVVSLRASGSTTQSFAGPGISGVLGSRNGWLVDINTTAQNGWAAFDMEGHLEAPYPHLHHRIYPGDGTSVDARPTYWGLPVVGLMVRTFRNGNLACGNAVCQGNYGGAFPHQYLRVTYPH